MSFDSHHKYILKKSEDGNVTIKLTEKQMNKIKYECNLLRMSMEQLYHVAPFMFDNEILDVPLPVYEPKPSSTITQEELDDLPPVPPYGYDGYEDDYYNS
jgi:hypothetical protein